MAMETILSTVYLDVYDHDTTPSEPIKVVASDKMTRFVEAYLQKRGEVYNPDPTAQAYLVALRPDKTTVVGPAEVIELVPAVEGEIVEIIEPVEGEDESQTVTEGGSPAVYGLRAELRKEMTEIVGSIQMQFKLVQEDKELRTETFSVVSAVNLENAGNCVIDLTE